MENVLLVTVPRLSDGYEAMRALRRLADQGAITLRGAAIIERQSDGRWYIPEETEDTTYTGTISGGLVGGILGLLAGPAGLLLGATAGLLVGSAAEAHDIEDVEMTIHALPHKVPPGSTALVADILETDPAAVDAALAVPSKSIRRMRRSQVEADLAAAETESAEEGSRRT